MSADLDLIVVGAGPAGRALTHRASMAGLSVALIDPDPTRPWRATYGAWSDELPGWLDAVCIAASSPTAVVYTPGRRVVERGYTVVDTRALQRFLSAHTPVIVGSASRLTARSVRLESGETHTATTVIDARGNPGRVGDGRPRQTAVGIWRDAQAAEMVVMDWRGPSGGATGGTFSYRVTVSASRELVEETCLAGAPPVGLDRLAALIAERIGGVAPDSTGSDPDVEVVDFPLLPADRAPWRRRGDEPLRFGAAGGLMHPATGYSLATTLRAVDDVVGALLSGRDPRETLWPRPARTVYVLRAAGLTALLRMTGDELATFFDAFFDLPASAQYAYLSSHTDLVGVGGAMWQVFRRLDSRGRTRLVRGFLAGLVARRL